MIDGKWICHESTLHTAGADPDADQQVCARGSHRFIVSEPVLPDARRVRAEYGIENRI
jgi:hypothetical protein